MEMLPDHGAQVFETAEYRRRNAELDEQLILEGIDVYMAVVPESLNHLTGFDPTGLYFHQLLVYRPGDAEPTLLTHRCEAELARVGCWHEEIRVWEHGQDPIDLTVALLREYGVRPGTRLGIELDSWYHKAATDRAITAAFPGVETVDVTKVGQRLRERKSPAELEHVRRAAGLSDIGLAALVDAMAPGVSERDLLRAATDAMVAAGSEYPVLPFIIGSGPRSGLFHALPTARRLQAGDPVMVELTGVSARYNANIVRTFVVGRASGRLRELHDLVRRSFDEALAAVGPGRPIGEVDRIARQVRAEYDAYIPARSGFGMGLGYPPIWASGPDVLEGTDGVFEPGMVVSLEPSIAQFEGVTMIYGYNLEITDDGVSLLQSTPPDWFEIGS